MSLATRLAAVRGRIRDTCVAVGRAPEEVRLLPVSKTHPAGLVREAHALGLHSFAENRVQEAAAKAAELRDLDISWAIIGHLQTNKARVVARFADELHSLDSLRLADELDRRLQHEGRSMSVFLQVNTSGEVSKSGVAPDELLDLARGLRNHDSLRPVGLMTVAAHTEDHAVVSDCFETLARLRDELRQSDVPGEWDELSMGMSGDLDLAIAHGATVVRVGTAIFGARTLV